MRAFIDIIVESEETSPARRAHRAFYDAWTERGSAWVDLSVENDTILMLNNISTTKRGHGDASRALMLLCKVADEHGVAIDLDVGPGSSEDDEAEGKPLDFSDLVDWYIRSGFEWSGDNGAMLRKPRSPQALEESLDPFAALARKHDTVEAFIRATDGMDVLYRGHRDDEVSNNAFMTDYVGHAAEYAEDGRIDAFAFSPSDVFKFTDERFDDMRRALSKLSDGELALYYRRSLKGNRHAVQFVGQSRTFVQIIRSEEPYSTIAGVPEKNDILVPPMQIYAWETHGKNIIAFEGSDYADYGGHIEFVVRDISKLVNLRDLYARVRGENLTESVEQTPPPVLYHGTTPYNAALIVLSGQIDQNESRDDDDHHDYSVSTTERQDVAEWFYDVARAVEQPFGFVFHIDTSKIAHHMRPFEAETAGQPEYEWRVYGDIPLSAVTKITLAGYKGTTKAAMREYVDQMERDYRYQHGFDEDKIIQAIMKLIKKARPNISENAQPTKGGKFWFNVNTGELHEFAASQAHGTFLELNLHIFGITVPTNCSDEEWERCRYEAQTHGWVRCGLGHFDGEPPYAYAATLRDAALAIRRLKAMGVVHDQVDVEITNPDNPVEGHGKFYELRGERQINSFIQANRKNISENARLTERASVDVTWFAGSKVVDKHGNPMVCYHAGNTEIERFRPWTHFGTSAAANQRVAYKYGMHGAVVYPVYLAIKSPLKVTDMEASDEAALLNAIVSGRYPKIDAGRARKDGVIAACEAAGYDGLVYRNIVEHRGRLSWVIFHPEQARFAA